MSTNVVSTVAGAVKTAIESITLSQRFTVHRSYGDWEDLLGDLEKDLRIDVVPSPQKTIETALFDRGKVEHRVRVAILLRKKMAREDHANGRLRNEVIDQLVGDLQTVYEYFVPSQPTQNGLRLTAVQQARWLEGTIVAPYSRALLKSPGQYSGYCEHVFGYAKTPSQ